MQFLNIIFKYNLIRIFLCAFVYMYIYLDLITNNNMYMYFHYTYIIVHMVHYIVYNLVMYF